MEKEKEIIELNAPIIEEENEDIFGREVSTEEVKDMKDKFDREYPPKEAKSAEPTYTPKSFNEQIYIRESGSTATLYVNVSGTWKSVTLT